jgi:hypothetical protein
LSPLLSFILQERPEVLKIFAKILLKRTAMKLATTMALFATAIVIIGCGNSGAKEETAKEVLISGKWYSSQNCENHKESIQFTFSNNQLEVMSYDNPNFEGESTEESIDLEYKGSEIYLQIDGEDAKCLVSSGSDKEWASLRCVPVDESKGGEITTNLYKTKDKAIKNNTKLCED